VPEPYQASPQRQRELQCIKDGNEMYNTAEGIELAIAEMELGVGWDMAIEVSYSIFSISGQRVDRGRVANCFDTVISIS